MRASKWTENDVLWELRHRHPASSSKSVLADRLGEAMFDIRAQLIGLGLLLSITAGARCNDPAEMKNDYPAIKSAAAEHICPPSPVKKVMERQYERCGGDGTHSTCGQGADFDRACAERYVVCYHRYIEDQKVLNEYNRFIVTCDPNAPFASATASSNANSENPVATDGTALARVFLFLMDRSDPMSSAEPIYITQKTENGMS